MIRRATQTDIPQLMNLLLQVNMVHHHARPDLFRPGTTKYSEQELADMLKDENNPIFVYDEKTVLGYAFCRIKKVENNRLFQDCKTLYIDDLCVDEVSRGKHIGKALFKFAQQYAREVGCYNVTLNVWGGNDSAIRFYQAIGMHIQKIGMEIVLAEK